MRAHRALAPGQLALIPDRYPGMPAHGIVHPAAPQGTLFDEDPRTLGHTMRFTASGDIVDSRASAHHASRTGRAYRADVYRAGRTEAPFDVTNPQKGDPPRQNYRFIEGQRVMPELSAHHVESYGADTWDDAYADEHSNRHWSVSRHFGREQSPLEISHEGNVFQGGRWNAMGRDAGRRIARSRGRNVKDANSNPFADWGPQMGGANKTMWSRYGEDRSISTSAVLHTAQLQIRRPGHDHIRGPMDPSSTVKILLHEGTPWIVDGHHRLMEARGRGLDTVPATVLNTDHLPDQELRKRGYLG